MTQQHLFGGPPVEYVGRYALTLPAWVYRDDHRPDKDRPVRVSQAKQRCKACKKDTEHTIVRNACTCLRETVCSECSRLEHVGTHD